MPGKACQKVAVFLSTIIGFLFVLSILFLLNLSFDNLLLFALVPPLAVLTLLSGIFFICRSNRRNKKFRS